MDWHASATVQFGNDFGGTLAVFHPADDEIAIADDISASSPGCRAVSASGKKVEPTRLRELVFPTAFLRSASAPVGHGETWHDGVLQSSEDKHLSATCGESGEPFPACVAVRPEVFQEP